MDGLENKRKAGLTLNKKEKEALKKKEKEDKKREKDEKKKLKKLQKEQKKSLSKSSGKLIAQNSSPSLSHNNGADAGGPHNSSNHNNASTDPKSGSQNGTPRKPGLGSGVQGASGANLKNGSPATHSGNTGSPASPHSGSVNDAVSTSQSSIMLKRTRRPRNFKEEAFNRLLEAISNGSFQGTELNLKNKHLDKYAAQDLAKVLERNNTLTSLDLSNNVIGDEGVVHISRMLEKNKTIKSLNLEQNELSSKGVKHIVACLNNNVFITDLYVDEKHVDMSDLGVGAGLTLENISVQLREQIIEILDSNIEFQRLLKGESNKLCLANRSQSYVNTNILEKFPALQIIDLSVNKLKTIPPQIGLLKFLTSLVLNSNRIETLPHQIGDCTSLVTVNVADNLLSELPLSITALPKLETLCLEKNKFEDLPRFALGAMQSLKRLELRDNRLTEMACMSAKFRAIVDRGGADTLAFLKANNEGQEQIYRMKLMFVGNGGVGKTTLLKNFLKERQNAAEPNVATDGIDIHTWSFRHPGKQYVEALGKKVEDESAYKDKWVNLSCWDFAGQEVYYATHTFFLSERAIYLVIFNLLEPEETNQIEYWLQSIESRTKDSPVIMVGTHLDDKRCTPEYVELYVKKLREKYLPRFQKHIVSFVSISNSEKEKGHFLKDLEELIKKHALRQPDMPTSTPLSYLALEEKMAGFKTLRPPILSWVDFSVHAQACKIPEAGVKTATKFLNDLGSLVWFPDDALCDLVVVNPQWITKTFATIVSLKSSFIRNGMLKITDLGHVWKTDEYPPELHPKLLLMLEKLEVVARLQHQGETKILIPCLLADTPPPSDELENVWPTFVEAVPQAGRVYSFGFVPLGFFSRLIVRFLQSLYIPIVYWKSGIILQKDDEKVKLTLTKDHARNKAFPVSLELWVRGNNPGRHLSPLVDNIDTLVEDWLCVKYEVTVPCLHCVNEGAEPYLFPLHTVESAVADGIQFVRCRGINNVAISSIAPDVAMSEFKGARVPYNHVEKLKQIGEGGFAKVYKGLWRNEIIALKELTLDTSATEESLGFEFEDAEDPLAIFAEFRKEVALMSAMEHANIVRLKGLCMDPFCMILEFCALGSLYDYIHEPKNNLNWAVVMKIAEDIANGMLFMHTFKPPLIHRDLKSPNVLLSIEQPPGGKPIIVGKIADFGLSRSMMLAGRLTKKVVDNPVWLAPEMLLKQDYDEKVDVYAFGVIMWELVSRQDFLGDINFLSAIEDAIKEGKRSEIPADCKRLFPEFAELITKCWAARSRDRPSFNDCARQIPLIRQKRLPASGARMPEFAVSSSLDVKITDAPTDAFASKIPQDPAVRSLTTSVPQMKHRKAGASDDPRPSAEVMAVVRGGDRTTKTLAPLAPRLRQGAPDPGRRPSNPTVTPGINPPRGLSVQPSRTSVGRGSQIPGMGGQTNGGSGIRSINSTGSGWQSVQVRPGARIAGADEVQISSFERYLPGTNAPITAMGVWDDKVWCGTANGNVYIYDVRTCTIIKTLSNAHGDKKVNAIAVVADTREMWTTGQDGIVKIWNINGEYQAEIATKTEVFCMMEVTTPTGGERGGPLCAVWLGTTTKMTVKGGGKKALEAEYGAIQVWDAVTRKVKKAWHLEGSDEEIFANTYSVPLCMCFHFNYVMVGAGKRILCYDSAFTARGYMEDHTGAVRAIINVGDEMWSCGNDKLIKVWNPRENGSDCKATMEGHMGEVWGLCTDADWVWSCGWDRRLFLWDAKDYKFIAYLPSDDSRTQGHNKSISCVVMTTCTVESNTTTTGKKLVRKVWSGGLDNNICLWKIEQSNVKLT